MCIKLATVFSGIGAIEQALKRLHIEYDIIFACDNGDINININTQQELNKIKNMTSVNEKRDYVYNLYKKMSKKTNFVEISYKANYNIVDNMFFYDIRMLDATDFKNKIDLLVGGSPCQSFSMIGDKNGFDDARGQLFYEYIRIIKESQPKVFIYENVYGVLTNNNGKTLETIKNSFSELGYYFKWQILDAKNYGIPQNRRRLFIVGFKDEKYANNFVFPKPIDLTYTMQDFLLDNCAIGNFTYDKNGNINIIHSTTSVNKFLSQKLINYILSPGTKKFTHSNDIKIDLQIARTILSTQGNTHRAYINNYVTTNDRIRALDPRESLRLMGFPDDFKIVVSNSQSYKQSGNSIVVDVLMAIIKEIEKVIRE